MKRATAYAGEVRLPAPERTGTLVLPADAQGIVLFAHGSGSSRLSPRNVAVSSALQRCGLGTLLFDLLSDEEAELRERVFDIPLLAQRLLQATAWVERQPEAAGLPTAYFGASTGAAAALVAAASGEHAIGAIVSRGGRPDLAGASLPAVRAPTLLVVGGDDTTVLGLNRVALAQLRCEKALAIVPGATHLFEEPGALEQVTQLAADWFRRHLGGRGAG